jgi:hypothetical protein
MQLIEERGLPVRPNSPPDVAAQNETSGGTAAAEPAASSGAGGQPQQP